jgi:beta-glucosidase-like glycosyl hydrolase
MKKIFLAVLFFTVTNALFSQKFLNTNRRANKWVDSVFYSLNEDEKIAQLFIIRAHSNLGKEHIDDVTNKIKKYNIGGLCFFQGGPIRQVNLTNFYQSIAKTPLLITMDAEWGIGMRLDSVNLFPKNMMLGALQNDSLVFEVGKAIGKQCKRMGIHLNYAPVVDVNNNPNNPVINDRSFGENKFVVSRYSNQLTNGIQSQGVMACAKHFPGHGDVAVDSHLDLPIINKSLKSLDSLELYPFKQQIKNNVGCIMTAHLSVPALDTCPNLPTSLSRKVVTNLLKNKLKFKGLIITDGLEMKGVTKYFPSGESSVQAIIAGNDLLCLPEQIDSSILKIKEAIEQHQLSKKQLYASVKKVLLAKYHLGLNKPQFVNTGNLTEDLNKQTNNLIAAVAENAITSVKQTNENIIPLTNITRPKDVLPRVALIHIGNGKENEFAKRMIDDWSADVYYYNNSYSMNYVVRDSIEPRTGVIISGTKAKIDLAKSIVDSCTKLKKYDAFVISVHQYNRRPANNFGLDTAAIFLIKEFAKNENAISFFFGNPYAIKNNCQAKNIVACYEDDTIIQSKAADLLQGKFKAAGRLPVTVCY